LSSYFGDICIGVEDKVVIRFGDIVLVERDGFSLRILNLISLQDKNIVSHMY